MVKAVKKSRGSKKRGSVVKAVKKSRSSKKSKSKEFIIKVKVPVGWPDDRKAEMLRQILQ